MKHPTRLHPVKSAMISLIAFGGSLCFAQTVAPSSGLTPERDNEDDTVVLSPFTVSGEEDRGYRATSTLAGTQIRTDLSDVGSAISVLTKEFLTDVGAYNNQTVLAYAVNTEVGGPRGNFSGANRNGSEGHVTEAANLNNPNANTRVRGLTSADNTRDYFLTDIPWDGYNISRVDLLRGPNAILFGLGSPAGIINAGTNTATWRNHNVVEVMFDEHGTRRASLDVNRMLIPKQLALRINLLDSDQKFQQRPAYRHDQRAFAVVKYAPGVMNQNGMRFEISANAEFGKIRSNNPRSVPPEDQLSNFWRPLAQGGVNKRTFNVFRDSTSVGQNSAEYNIVTYGQFGPGLQFYVNGSGQPGLASYGIPTFGSRAPDGSTITTTSANNPGPSWGNQLSDNLVMRTTQQWAPDAGLPFAGVGAYRNDYITDPSVFDFYHKLLDGPNKEEYNRWRAGTLNIQHTFLNDSIGYDLTAYRERMKSGAWSALGWEGNALKLDINERLASGPANANVGRAYVEARTGGGAWSNVANREAYRAKLFGTHDFERKRDSLWAKIVGTQTITGVYSDERAKNDNRGYRLFDLDRSYRAKVAPNPRIIGQDTADGLSAFRYYVSPDLRSKNGTQGIQASALDMPFINWAGGTTQFTRFDNTWTAPSTVNPSAPWTNPLDPNNAQHSAYFQSNNPANYKGWTTDTATLLTFRSKLIAPGTTLTAKDYLTESATLTDSRVSSTVGVWQGSFWHHSIVGIYGMRTDRSRSYNYNTSYYNKYQNSNPLTGGADLSSGTYNYSNPQGTTGFLESKTKNWSVMAHINKLIPGFDPLPFNLRLYYNKGENFQPAAGRTDMLGRPLPPPGGTTTDKSVMISTKDDRFTLRVTRYETALVNATSTDAEIGALWALQQSLPWPGAIVRQYLRGEIDYAGWGSSGGDINQLKTSILPKWMAFEKEFRTKFPDFVNAWMGNNTIFGTDALVGPDAQATRPAGSVFTEDSISKGYEVEFTANPTKNWRIAINASKTEAVRSNVPGKGFAEVAAFVDNAFQKTDVGLAPIWWPQNTAGVRGVGPYPFFYRPEWLKIQALNGQSAGEIRKYHANLINSYDFTEGPLKGFGAGVGYRYQDKSVIGYAPIMDPDGSLRVNINAPFYAPKDETFDLWLSYSRRLTHKINWKIQLNVFNVGGKNELVPIAAGVDPVRALALKNIGPTTVVPMKATGYSIKEGMSWQISNRFEF
ncbi:MAG: TonB-dependent receptor plug domain-containing protein [Opitutus sp.]